MTKLKQNKKSGQNFAWSFVIVCFLLSGAVLLNMLSTNGKKVVQKNDKVILDTILLFFDIDDSVSTEGDNEIWVMNNGLIQYRLGNNKRYKMSDISEAEYATIVKMMLENDKFFINSVDEDDYDNNPYYDKNLKDAYGYSIRYSYYLNEADKILENIQMKGITCNLDKCPKTLNDVIYKIIEATPKYEPELKDFQSS
jgi:hypothetical protein